MPPQLRRTTALRGGLTHAIGGVGIGIAAPLWGTLTFATVWLILDTAARPGASLIDELGEFYSHALASDPEMTLMFGITLIAGVGFIAASWGLGTMWLRSLGFRRAFRITVLVSITSWFVPSALGAGLGMLFSMAAREVFGYRLMSIPAELVVACSVSAFVVAALATTIGAFLTPPIVRWLQPSAARSRPRSIPAGTAPAAL